MRPLTFLILAVALAGCLYPRRSTPLHSVETVSADADLPEHLYTLQVIGADIPPRKPMGLPWDEDGSAPDPFVRLLIEDEVVWESEVQTNTLRPVWDAELPANLYVGPQTKLRLELWDRDSAGKTDPIGYVAHVGPPPDAQPGAPARITLSNGATLTVQLSPPRAHRGVGIRRYELRYDALYVVELEPDSPAARAGISEGDHIVAIGGESVEALGPNAAASRLSMSMESNLPLEVRDAEGRTRKVELQGYVWRKL